MVHISQQLRNSYDALENVTKWWDGYSMDSYRIAARPYQAFQSYMGEIYDKSKGYVNFRPKFMTNPKSTFIQRILYLLQFEK